jgi:hypothetical protein
MFRELRRYMANTYLRYFQLCPSEMTLNLYVRSCKLFSCNYWIK